MYKNRSISVIMPCRNEGAHLAEIMRRIPKFVDEIIIVSNRSTDNTVEMAQRLGLKVYEDNRAVKGIGYGFAHMTGIEAATSDIIAGIDGDATYPIENIDGIIDDLLKRNLDFISCNRYPLQDGTKIPLKLRLGVAMLNLETRLLYGIKVKDVLSGMWVFKREISPLLRLTMGDWNLSPQIKINAALHRDIQFGEHSIAQHQRRGTTKQRYFKTGLSHLVWLMRNWLTMRKPAVEVEYEAP
jgi:glycosyltransferase involved in cell wall biosynthesis